MRIAQKFMIVKKEEKLPETVRPYHPADKISRAHFLRHVFKSTCAIITLCWNAKKCFFPVSIERRAFPFFTINNLFRNHLVLKYQILETP